MTGEFITLSDGKKCRRLSPGDAVERQIDWIWENRGSMPLIKCTPDVLHMGTIRKGRPYCLHCEKFGDAA